MDGHRNRKEMFSSCTYQQHKQYQKPKLYNFLSISVSTAPEDFYRLDPKKSPKENAYDIYVALSLKDTNDTKRLYLLNEFVTLLQQNKDINLGFTTDELLFW